jgi:four helix bundle protein
MSINSYRDLDVWKKSMEWETHIEIAKRLGYIAADTAVELIDKTSTIGRMLNGLRRSLEKKRDEVQNG